MKIISRFAVRITAVAAAAVVAGGGAGIAYASSSDAKPKAPTPTTTGSTGTIARGHANQMMNGMLRYIPPWDRAAAQRMHREMLPMMTGTGTDSGVGTAPGSGDPMMGAGGTDGSGRHG